VPASSSPWTYDDSRPASRKRGFRVHPCLEATISVARSEHPVTRTNWEGTGVVPDVETAAADALETALRLATDAKPVAPGR